MANQRAIAQFLGLNQSTVSRALKNDARIPLETRQRVAEAAEKLGYHPSPQIAMLMERIRSGRNVRNQGCLALVVDAASEDDWLNLYTFREQYEGIRQRAARSGYRTECFFLRQPGMTARRLDAILRARGIIGLILTTPKRADTPVPELRWDRYVCVTTGYSWSQPPVDRVSTKHRQNVDRCFKELVARGYRRIAMHLLTTSVEYADANWSAGFYLNQARLPPNQRMPLFLSEPNTEAFPHFEKWYRRHRPDAIIAAIGYERVWARWMGLTPEDLAIVCFNRPPGTMLAGMDENSRVVGEMACDLVISKITHNELGVPEYPRLILIDGVWREGESLPASPIS